MEDAAGAVVQVLVQNLISMLSDEFELVRGFKDDLEKLQDSLRITQGFLSDAEEKEIKEKAVKEWLKQLEDVAFEADDVLDEINYQRLQKEVKNQKGETKEVSCSFSSSSTSILFRRKMAHKISDLNKKLENLNKIAESKGLEKAVVTAPDASTVGFDQETNSYSIEPNFVGRENDVAEIVKMVLNAPAEEKISVIPIVGMGGLGKTSLTQQIYHHEKIKSRFEKKIWICVSLKFDELTLFQNIHSSLTGENVQFNVTTEVLLQKIHKVLESKRYLMILDDVWNEDSMKWKDFMKSLVAISDGTQNVIIVTTRSEIVVKTLPLYKLKGLSNDQCWSIIKAKAFSIVDGPPEYEEIGKQFAQKCGGLPLAAHVIGGMLCGEPKEEWSSILMNEFSNFGRDDDNHIMRILKLSYNRLPSPLLKKCFAYCSVFPQDFNIKKETLIEQWMGEGFLQTNQENVNLETIGNKIFNHLLQVSLFQESKRDDLGNITHCRMHDYVHDLACLVSGDRSGTLTDSANDVNEVRYLYLQTQEPHHTSNERAKYLRTLIFDGEVADNMFLGYSRLRVLTLTNSSVQELPIKPEKQIHMRFLDISRTNITKLPDTINKLSNLQTLVVTNLQNLPNTIIDLLNLRHLYISSIELPPFIGKLSSLQTLPYYVVGHDSGCRISELKNLKNLKGSLKIQNLERVKDKGEAEQADLFGKSGILTLVLEWTRSREGDINDKSVLEGLQPHSNFKSLKIRGYRSINFPSWIIKMTVYNAIEKRRAELTNLVKISIKDCQCEKVPNLGHLPCLKFLKLEKLPAVQYIGLSFYDLDDCSTSTTANDVNVSKTTSVFPALQNLYLFYMRNLKEWVNVESRVTTTFPCLEYLKIRQCPQLESVPTRFPCLKELETVKIGRNVCLSNICTNTSSLQRLVIQSYSGIISFGDECFIKKNRDLSYLMIRDCPNIIFSELQKEEDSSNIHYTIPSLKYFEIDNCYGLKSIPPNFDFSSLEQLYIEICPELKSIPNVEFSSLQRLYISNCRALTSLPVEYSSLESLSLKDLPNVENMDDVMSGISRMSHLLRLILTGLPQWTNSSAVFCEFPKLLEFEFSGFSESLDTVSFNDHLKRILHGTHHLQRLSIKGNEELGSLPDHIQHLHSLQELWIEDCGIEALPEWIGNLSSLRNLWIENFKRLAHLPSRKAMQHITGLHINECPLLTDKLGTQQESTPAAADDDNSEWTKISHIQFVLLDGERLPTRNYTLQAPVGDEKKFAGCFPIPRIKLLPTRNSTVHSPVQDENKFAGCFPIPRSWKR